jgi:GxxExxY protein
VSIDPEERRLALDQITEGIVGCVHQVSNTLESGFLEKNYVNALAAELERTGLRVARQHRNEVRYRDGLVGGFGVAIGAHRRLDELAFDLAP